MRGVQTPGGRQRPTHPGPQAQLAKVPVSAQGGTGAGGREERTTSRPGVQQQARPRGPQAPACQARAAEEVRERHQPGRGAARGDQRVQGAAAVSVVQGQAKGRRAHQVLPRVLLRLPAEAIRHAAAQVSQVQRRLRRQRLPQTLSLLVYT